MTRTEIETLINDMERETRKVPRVIWYNGAPADMVMKELASALLAEMDKPKVWDNAPGIAEKACVIFTFGEQDIHCPKYEIYTRTLPKSRAREIAEEYQERWLQSDSLKGVDVIESAIEKALSEREVDE